jgi:hypothetical protein
VLLLVTAAHPQVLEHLPNPNLGRLVQPRHYWRIKDTAEAGIPWAADNDAFGGFGPEEEKRFVHMLGHLEGQPGCKFVTLPDVVGDARATADLFNKWYWSIRNRGLPVGLVAQNGIDELGVPWDKIDALFIGGDDEFKLGPVAEELALEGKRRGKWVHMGRVNGRRRVEYAKTLGCDSFDGSSFARWRSTWLPIGLEWAAQPSGGRQLRIG